MIKISASLTWRYGVLDNSACALKDLIPSAFVKGKRGKGKKGEKRLGGKGSVRSLICTKEEGREDEKNRYRLEEDSSMAVSNTYPTKNKAPSKPSVSRQHQPSNPPPSSALDSNAGVPYNHYPRHHPIQSMNTVDHK